MLVLQFTNDMKANMTDDNRFTNSGTFNRYNKTILVVSCNFFTV